MCASTPAVHDTDTNVLHHSSFNSKHPGLSLVKLVLVKMVHKAWVLVTAVADAAKCS